MFNNEIHEKKHHIYIRFFFGLSKSYYKKKLDKLCNGNALTRNKIQLSQNSLNSITSNEKHNRIINSHLSKSNFDNLELDERNEHDNEMLIPYTDKELDLNNENYDNKYKESLNEKANKDDNEHHFKNDNSNLNITIEQEPTNLQTNLGTSLNNNLNNLSRTTNEIPRLSLDSSANYRLQHQLQQHHRQLKQQEQQTKMNELNVYNLNNQMTNLNDDLIDQNLNKSHGDLASQPNQTQYKSFNSLHQNFNMPISTTTLGSNLKHNSSNCNLNTIVLYSTSMTSINYCCGNEGKGETISNSKKNSINSQKLTNVLTTPLQCESVKIEKKNNCLIVKKQSKKSTYLQTKRRSTVEKIMTVGKYLNILLSWNILRDRIFLWFAISNFLTSLGECISVAFLDR